MVSISVLFIRIPTPKETPVSLVTATGKPDIIKLVDAVRSELRTIISRWSNENPNRLIKVIRVNEIHTLDTYDRDTQRTILGMLESYVGSALPKDDPVRGHHNPQETPIDCAYELHPMPISGVVEVLMRRDELKRQPVRRLAEEVAYQAQAYAQRFDIDDVFSFTIARCVVERVEKLSKSHKTNFRQVLNRCLEKVGLYIQSGTVYSVLEIRRNR